MVKDIKDYLHLYMKQWCEVYDSKNGGMDGQWALDGTIYHSAMCDYLKVKLHLRPLSSMTDEEKEEEIQATNMPDDGFENRTVAAAGIKYLLSKGFDLFGLIEAGLAIERKEN